MVQGEVIFGYNSVKYEENFITLIVVVRNDLCINLLKHFPPHLNCIVIYFC